MERHELTPLQSRLFEMLKWFDGFCRANDLNYYLLGGTMLGAARHQGFIPWDDDIDVGLFRKDYERFINLMKGKKECGKYIVEAPDSENKDFCYPYAKVYDVSTTLIEHYAVPLKRGIFLDIFPLDYLGNSHEECQKKYAPIKNLYNFYLTRVAAPDGHRSWYKNAAVKVSRCIPFINNRKLRIRLDHKCANVDDRLTWGGNLLGNWGIKEIMPISVMGKPKEYIFEGHKVYGVADYDSYLTNLYGNWRELPPKDKQVTHHDYLELDLDKPFRQDKYSTSIV